jgi:hypothetical protein
VAASLVSISATRLARALSSADSALSAGLASAVAANIEIAAHTNENFEIDFMSETSGDDSGRCFSRERAEAARWSASACSRTKGAAPCARFSALLRAGAYARDVLRDVLAPSEKRAVRDETVRRETKM